MILIQSPFRCLRRRPTAVGLDPGKECGICDQKRGWRRRSVSLHGGRTGADECCCYRDDQRARKATSSIPIVIVQGGEIEGTGLIASLRKLGGNVTGIQIFAPDLMSKRVELLKQLVPNLTRLGSRFSDHPGCHNHARSLAEHHRGRTSAKDRCPRCGSAKLKRIS